MGDPVTEILGIYKTMPKHIGKPLNIRENSIKMIILYVDERQLALGYRLLKSWIIIPKNADTQRQAHPKSESFCVNCAAILSQTLP